MTFILKVQMKFEIEHYFKNFLASVCLFPRDPVQNKVKI